jgi:ATPase subunit of ABC transporter with duplicated ATPase domains
VVSHDRELLERMDAILELTTLGLTRYGGNWSQYRARKAVELQAAEDDLAHARKHQSEIERKTRITAERKQRRDAAGSRKAGKGDMPRILIGARRNAAQASGGSTARLSEKLSAQADDAVSAARARIEVLQQLSITLPSTGLHAERRVLTLHGVAAGHDPRALLLTAIDLTVTGPERIAIAGPNGMGKSTLLRVIAGSRRLWRGRLLWACPAPSSTSMSLSSTLPLHSRQFPRAQPTGG